MIIFLSIGLLDHVVLKTVSLVHKIGIVLVSFVSDWVATMIALAFMMAGIHVLLSGSVCFLKVVLDLSIVIMSPLDTEVIVMVILRLLSVM